MHFCFLLIFFQIIVLQKVFQDYHHSVNRLDSDHSRRFVGRHLGPNGLKRLSADGPSRPRVFFKKKAAKSYVNIWPVKGVRILRG